MGFRASRVEELRSDIHSTPLVGGGVLSSSQKLVQLELVDKYHEPPGGGGGGGGAGQISAPKPTHKRRVSSLGSRVSAIGRLKGLGV